MEFNNIFDNNKINKEKFLNYGFKFENFKYTYKVQLKNKEFFVIFTISDKTFSAKVFDSMSNEEYLPFNVSSTAGAFVSDMKAEVENLVNAIVLKCFDNDNVKEKILKYVKDKYNTEPIAPWKEYPTFYTLNKKNKKWYGLIMTIPYKTLSIEKDGMVDVINIKLNSDKIKNIIDKINFFPAYHMNKKYWITILLTSNIDMKIITDLIDESFNLVS